MTKAILGKERRPPTIKRSPPPLSEEIRTSCPSKVILAGEDAVVFGATSVACAVSLMNECILRPWSRPFYRITLGRVSLQRTPKECAQGYARLREFCSSGRTSDVNRLLDRDILAWLPAIIGRLIDQGACPPSFDARLDLALPLGSGVGGSAAAAHLLGKAALYATGRQVSLSEIYELTLASDVIAHGGEASGTDSATIAYGGLRAYQREKGHWPIPVLKMPDFILCYSGKKKSTRESLEKFRRLALESSDRFRHIVEGIDDIANREIELLKAGADASEIGRLMNMNQHFLAVAGVSTPEIDRIIDLAREHGALGAKITGGGSGGYVLILARPKRSVALARYLKSIGRPCRFARIYRWEVTNEHTR